MAQPEGLPTRASDEAYSTLDASLEEGLFTRRLRHITSIQVRNLTPFPVRDAFTSALLHPSESLHPSSSANDDLSIISSRRRARKVSSNSVATRSSLKWEDGLEDDSPSPTSSSFRVRKTSTSKFNFAAAGSTGAPLHGSPKPSSFVKRARANSKASSTSSRAHLGSTLGSAPAARTSSFLPDHSQNGLEKVINARLLETCLVIDITEFPPEPLSEQPLSPKSANLSSPTQPDLNGKAVPRSAPPNKKHFRSLPSRHGSISSNSDRMRSPSPELSSNTRVTSDVSEAKRSRVNNVNGKAKIFPPSQSKLSSKPSHLPETPLKAAAFSTSFTYRSPILRPSTNPSFSLEPGSMHQLHEWNRLNAQWFKAAIWGKVPGDVHRTGWDDSSPPPYPDEPGYRWRVLQEWDVHLNALVPVSDEIHSCDLPSNTLLLTLGPHGRTYYIPNQTHLPSRASTPPAGYSSDPESERHKVERVPGTSSGISPSSRRRRRKGTDLTDSKDVAKTATWPDIFQLATLQALIYDNDTSLSTISGKVDRFVAEDHLSPLRRDISERQDRISELKRSQQSVLEACSKKREAIEARLQLLESRREMLFEARDSIEEAEDAEVAIADQSANERSQLASLRVTMTSIRSNLISILADIFPIELYSPPDLIFTVLDVALPLPLSTNDPAPPLSVPEHKDINEDSIATALGYVAQVLQILAAYLGTNLLYPVTCIGSRSLIRDGISAMIGPRMFPLYSKGVDTYRFEYGVFLLNKNIEMLMAERDLRALDLRHTLPNLKNLLLTLSHDRSGPFDLPKSKVPDPSSSSLSLLSLDSEADKDGEEAEEEDSNGQTPKASAGAGESRTPPRSGATTPTPTPTITDDSRKSRFLALAPFTGFLRGRYPSTSRASTKSVHESAEGEEDDGDEEDRSTIHGLFRDDDHETGEPGRSVEKHPEPKHDGEINHNNIATSLPATVLPTGTA